MIDIIKKIPKVSIVFTSYNHAEFLEKALDSLLSQSFKNYELIIIDDCSTDGSQEILKEYQHKDGRIQLYLSEVNSGNYVISTNRGASLAVGEYIIFAQCDDFAESMQLEYLVKTLDNNPDVAVAFSSSKMIDENDNLIDIDYNVRTNIFRDVCKTNTILTSKQMTYFLSESCVIPNLSAAMIRREKFIQLEGFSTKYKVLADWDFWLRMSVKENFFYIKKPLNNFRQHNNTIRKTTKIKIQICELLEMFSSALNLEEFTDSEQTKIKENISKILMGFIIDNPRTSIMSIFSLLNKSRGIDSKFPFIFFRNGVKFLNKKLSNIGR